MSLADVYANVNLQVLADVARVYLCIPASAAQTERANSSASFQLGDFRHKLADDTLEMLVVVRDFIQQPTFDNYSAELFRKLNVLVDC